MENNVSCFYNNRISHNVVRWSLVINMQLSHTQSSRSLKYMLCGVFSADLNCWRMKVALDGLGAHAMRSLRNDVNYNICAYMKEKERWLLFHSRQVASSFCLLSVVLSECFSLQRLVHLPSWNLRREIRTQSKVNHTWYIECRLMRTIRDWLIVLKKTNNTYQWQENILVS